MDDAILRHDTILRDDELRLNLEQQKIRAKELRRAVAAGDPRALARITRHHPDAHDVAPDDMPARLARLSDAQLVIARELGLPSWPKLKAHVERLARARAAIAGHEAPDADCPTLHLRCGSDIRVRLQQAGFTGDFLEFSDPYCQGPVPRDGDLAAIRARFVADNYLVAEPQAAAKLAAEYEGLARAADAYRRVVLWFEHDGYDQLILARVLAAFAQRRPRVLELICTDRFPAVTRFNGLGQLSPAALRMLWDGRTPVTASQLRLGTAVWAALREPEPLALHAIAADGTPELPPMAPALARHLQELPWIGDGLSLTQRLALARLREGPATVAELFRTMQLGTEPLPFLGDLMFWAVLREMLGAGRPPFTIHDADVPWPQQMLTLTPTGETLMAGEADWMNLRPPPRWVGGVPIGRGAPDWRWSAAREQPVLRE